MEQVIIKLDSDIENKKEIKRLKRKVNRLLKNKRALKKQICLLEGVIFGHECTTYRSSSCEQDSTPGYSEGMYDGCGI